MKCVPRRAAHLNARATLRGMAEPLGLEDAGWVEKGSRTQEPYAWNVRCPEHPPESGSWEPLAAADCPGEVPACDVCGEFLI